MVEKIIEDIGEKQEKATKMYCDKKLAMEMAKNYVYQIMTRQADIAINYHIIGEAIEEGEVELKFSRLGEQVADIFINALPKGKVPATEKSIRSSRAIQKGENVVINVL